MWTADGSHDVAFYVDLARRSGGPVIELGVGTGRVAIPVARAGVRVIGVDFSQEMLSRCAQRAQQEGVASLVDLRLGDFTRPAVTERVPLVICPLRSLMCLESDADRRSVLDAVHRLLRANGRFAFDVFSPEPRHANENWGKWTERAPGVWDRSEFDWQQRIHTISVRTAGRVTTLRQYWIDREEWRTLLEAAGLRVTACYGWFDGRPCGDSPFSILLAERRD
jgi:SAM-dependent methyltransferase